MNNDDKTNAAVQQTGLAGVAGSEPHMPAIAVMHELVAASKRAELVISHQHTSAAFTLGKIKAAIDLLEAGNTRGALEYLRLAHASGCHEMDNIPLTSPNQ